MSGWTIAWLLWIAAFFVIEIAALVNTKAGDTLSENVWAWASIKDKGGHWRLRRLLLVAFLAWACLHFLTGGQF